MSALKKIRNNPHHHFTPLINPFLLPGRVLPVRIGGEAALFAQAFDILPADGLRYGICRPVFLHAVSPLHHCSNDNTYWEAELACVSILTPACNKIF